MINFWFCWKENKASILKGGFITLKDAIDYYNNKASKYEKLVGAIFDKNRKIQLYPRENKNISS